MEFEVDPTATFYGVIKSVDNLVSILKAIHIADNSSCFIHEDGMVFTVEQSRAVKAIAYVKSSLFHVYNIKDTEAMSAFGLSIDTLTDGFSSVMPQTNKTQEFKPVVSVLNFTDKCNHCEITYDGTGSLLGLRRTIKETNQFVHCTMIPFEPEEESEELKFDDTQDPMQLIVIPAKWFKDVLDELESSTEYVQLTLSPEDLAFQVIGSGAHGVQDSDIPRNSGLINNFSCHSRLSFSYLYPHIVMCKKALALSYEVSIEIHQSGALRLIIKLIDPDAIDNFIEFSFLPSTRFA